MQRTTLLILAFSVSVSGCRQAKEGPSAAREGTGKPAGPGFVKVENGRFVLDGKAHYFVGANFWQGMNLGVEGPSGDRARLLRELDRMGNDTAKGSE